MRSRPRLRRWLHPRNHPLLLLKASTESWQRYVASFPISGVGSTLAPHPPPPPLMQFDAISDIIAPHSFLLQLQAAAAITTGPAAVDLLLSELGSVAAAAAPLACAEPGGAAAGVPAAPVAGDKRPRDAELSNVVSNTDAACVIALLTAHRNAFASVPAGLESVGPTITDLRTKATSISEGLRALSATLQQAQKKAKGVDDPREDIIRRSLIAYLKTEKPKAVRAPKLPPVAGAPEVPEAGATAHTLKCEVPPMPVAAAATGPIVCPLPVAHVVPATQAPAAAPPAAPLAAAALVSPAVAPPVEVDADTFTVIFNVFGMGRAAYDAIVRGR